MNIKTWQVAAATNLLTLRRLRLASDAAPCHDLRCKAARLACKAQVSEDSEPF